MSFSGYQFNKLSLVLLAGVCLAATGLIAAQTTTTSGTKKPAAHPVTHAAHPTAMHPPHPTTTIHPVAKKAGTPTRASHATTARNVTPHSNSTRYVARKTVSHAATASASKRTPTRTTATVAQRTGSPASKRRQVRRQPRTLTSQQRLARLHLQPERVQEIQQALIHEGYLQGDANGQWDMRTHDAMLHYQTDHGFPPTGLPEAKSLMKLGLGSHPLPAELDHGPTGAPAQGAAQGVFSVSPSSPPASEVAPPS